MLLMQQCWARTAADLMTLAERVCTQTYILLCSSKQHGHSLKYPLMYTHTICVKVQLIL